MYFKIRYFATNSSKISSYIRFNYHLVPAWVVKHQDKRKYILRIGDLSNMEDIEVSCENFLSV